MRSALQVPKRTGVRQRGWSLLGDKGASREAWSEGS